MEEIKVLLFLFCFALFSMALGVRMRPREQVNFRCGKAKWSQESQSCRAEWYRRVLACRSEGSLWKTGGGDFGGQERESFPPKHLD